MVTMRPRSIQKALSENWTRCIVLILEHLPLATGIIMTAAVHALRTKLPDAQGSTLDLALLVAEFGLFLGLVAVRLIDVLVELFEAIGVGIYRVRYAWGKGQRFRPPAQDS